jgi:hypothetical protein
MPKLQVGRSIRLARRYGQSTGRPRTVPRFTLHSETLSIAYHCDEAGKSTALVKVRVPSRIDTGAEEIDWES